MDSIQSSKKQRQTPLPHGVSRGRRDRSLALTPSHAAGPVPWAGSELAHGDLPLLPQPTTLPWVGQGPGRPSPNLGITRMTKPRGPLPTPALSYLGPEAAGVAMIPTQTPECQVAQKQLGFPEISSTTAAMFPSSHLPLLLCVSFIHTRHRNRRAPSLT